MRAPAVITILSIALGAFFVLTRRPVSSGGSVIEPIRELVSGPRGLRNNNPGNIVRTKDMWKGMSADQSGDSRFVVFDAPVWGLRALVRVLRKYMTGGLTSIGAIIARWAPTNENDTAAYVDAVSRAVGVQAGASVGWDDAMLGRLVAAIVAHENGQQPFDYSTIQQAIQLERES